MSEGVVVQLAGGEIVSCNPAAERILGLTRDQMAGRTSLDPKWRAIHEDGSPFPGETHPALETLQTGEAMRDVVMGVHRPDGSLRWISINSNPIPGPDGRSIAVVTTFVDITARKADGDASRRGAEALRRRGEEMRTLMEMLPSAIWIAHDPECRVITGNLAANRFYEASEEENVSAGSTLGEDRNAARRFFRHGRELAAEDLPMQVAARTGREVTDFDFDVISPSGKRRTLLGNASPLFNETEGVRGTIAAFLDITERKRAEEALREHQEMFSLFLRHSPIHAYIKLVTPTESRVLQASESFRQMIGIPGSQMVGKTMAELFPAEFAAKITADDWAVVAKGEVLTLEEELDGRSYMTIKYPIVVGEKCMLAGYTIDITERKQAENRLMYVVKAIESTSEAIGISDAEGHHFYQNKSLSDLFEYATAEELEAAGGGPAVVKDPEVARDMFSRIMQGRPWAGELEMVTKSGRVFQAYERADAIKDHDGNIVGLIGVISDITERKRAEEALRTLHVELEQRVSERTSALEEANRELEAFSYSVSHELRGPLRAIDGHSAMIARDWDGMLDDEGRRHFGQIRWNAQRMGQLIDDLLTFSRAGRTDLAFGTVDMTGAAKAAFAQAVPDPVSLSRISFSVGDLSEARGDAILLQRVWENILSNAVKFTGGRERPEIRVEGSVEGGESVYTVRDNGIGFDMTYVDKLFGVFHRLHGQHEFEGTGVGLALVRRIIVRHGGRVWAEGELDRGATFSFLLPK